MRDPRNKTEHHVFDCGCQMWADTYKGRQTFTFEPHSLDCEFFQSVVTETARRELTGDVGTDDEPRT